MVKTCDVAFKYPSIQFRFPDISCEAGQVLLVSGASGKGKTTLLHLLAGLLRPWSGAIYIGGTDIARLSARKADRFRGSEIGIIFQQSHFVESLSVLDNILLAANMSGAPVRKEKALQLLRMLNIDEQAHKLPAHLSQGQQQRVSIARALINSPALILADEPTSSLDDTHCERVADLLGVHAQQAHAALVIVTHDQRLKQYFPQSIELI
jgi:putative ABC transport system ATP-binding protein